MERHISWTCLTGGHVLWEDMEFAVMCIVVGLLIYTSTVICPYFFFHFYYN